jgi:methylenetetrahydrofolate dehydrogenase (NADP+) / methenyltetrahydrofolate cyclohydrolase
MLLKSQDIKDTLFKKLLLKRNTIKSELNLDIVLATDNPASLKYVSKKQEYGKLLNINVRVNDSFDNIEFGDSNGVIIQLPTSKKEHLNINMIPLQLDVDLMNNFEELISTGVYPPTIKAILQFIEMYNCTLINPKVVIIGEGILVGKPLINVLKSQGYDVIICNEYTPNTKDITKLGDLIISATGVPLLIDKSYINQDKKQLWIDAGTAESNGKIVGDINHEIEQFDNITLVPCPGGVGPLTVHNLFENLIELYELNK